MSTSSISGRIKKIEQRIFPKRPSEPDPEILKAIVNIDNALNAMWAKFNETQRALWVLKFNEEPNQISYEDSLRKAQRLQSDTAIIRTTSRLIAGLQVKRFEQSYSLGLSAKKIYRISRP